MISLLYMTYKLVSACIAEKRKSAHPNLIDEDQIGYIAGRYIGENIYLFYNIINYAETYNKLGR